MENNSNNNIEETVKKDLREAGMMLTCGSQGVGKTYQNMHIIKNYIKDKISNKVRGRKCLIFDTNGEYTKEEFSNNGITDVDIKNLSIRDIEQWGRSANSECRRIDAKGLGIREKKEAVEYILKVYRNGMLVLEDINTYLLSVTHQEEIVGGLVNLRHRAVDVIISFQSIRPVEPRLWQNCRWIRMHYQADNVNDIKGKVPNPTFLKICQIIVNNKYHGGDKRFFVYIHNLACKVEGKFTKKDFDDACAEYLSANKKYIREYRDTKGCGMDEALKGLILQYRGLYYGN
jgi:hypothetical protein